MERIAFIGFGEAAQAFAPALRAALSAYDRKSDQVATREAKFADYARAGVPGRNSASDALGGVAAAFSLVTADQALAAVEAAAALPAGAFWFDMNSVAPDTKRAAAVVVEARGGRYVDVAVMSPVHPKRAGAPLLVSGPHAEQGAAFLREIGFTDVTVMSGPVGAASAVKMIRSVMIKGIEALSAECAFAAREAGVLDEVIASLDGSPPPAAWRDRLDYNLDRMVVHGSRRAAEMEEVVATLEGLGVGATMSRGTVARQRALGRLCIAPPDGLEHKLRTLAPFARSPGERAA